MTVTATPDIRGPFRSDNLPAGVRPGTMDAPAFLVTDPTVFFTDPLNPGWIQGSAIEELVGFPRHYTSARHLECKIFVLMPATGLSDLNGFQITDEVRRICDARNFWATVAITQEYRNMPVQGPAKSYSLPSRNEIGNRKTAEISFRLELFTREFFAKPHSSIPLAMNVGILTPNTGVTTMEEFVTTAGIGVDPITAGFDHLVLVGQVNGVVHRRTCETYAITA